MVLKDGMNQWFAERYAIFQNFKNNLTLYDLYDLEWII